MKRILSFILATAIILSLIPAAFAADTTLQNPSNVQIVYDACTFGGATSTAVEFDNITYETTQGFWKYHSAQTGSGSIKYGTLQPSNNSCKWVAIAIYVPAAGDYTVNLTRTFYKTSGCIGGMYILPGDTKDIAAELEKNTGCITKEIKYNDPDYSYSDNSTNATKAYDVGTHNFPSAGEYIVVYTQESIPETVEDGVIRPGTLMLTGGTGVALMGIREKEIEVAGTTSISASKSTDKLRDKKTVSDVTYKSSNDSIAKVSADGTVTGVGNGAAVITVSGENYAIPLEVTVKVNDPKLPTIKYDISGIIKAAASGASSSAFTEAVTNGFFRYISGQGTATKFSSATNYIKLWKKNNVVFEVYVPVAGTYTMSINHAMAKTLTGASVYVNEASAAAGHYDCYDANVANDYSVYADSQIEGITLNKGWNTIKFVADSTESEGNNASIGSFTLSAGTGDALMPYLNGNSTLEIGESATLSGFLSSTATAVDDETYSVEGDAVTVGTDGIITAVKPGKATVTMTTATTATAGNTCTVEITVPDAKLDNTVQVYTDALTGGKITRTTSDSIDNVAVGTLVEVEAIADTGCVFSHWQDSEGKYVSDSPTYSFRPYVNTSVIAVFDKTTVEDGDTKTVYFYNGNGEYVTEKKTTGNSIEMPADATLTGYIFDMWTVDGVNEFDGMNIIKAVTRAVAQYQKTGKTYSDLKINNTDTVVYDTAKSFNDNTATYWMRNGKIVDYGTTYTHYMWDAATIEAGTGDVEEIPVIVLNAHSVEDDFYMIEYDLPEGYTKLEAGILFGDSTHNTVDSCYYKAKSANKPETAEHGQFTATKSDDTQFAQTVVRGYLVYKDGTTNRVIYAD